MRISVVGNPGSGKTTAAKRIADAMSADHLELDSIRHQPGWRELPDPEFRERVISFIDSRDTWVVDGNYSVVQPAVWERADTVVWLDLPFVENIWNVTWRTVRRVVLRQELWNGNRESWKNLFSIDPRQSVIAWAWTRHPIYRARYGAARDDPQWEHLTFVRLTSREELDRWVNSLRSSSR